MLEKIDHIGIAVESLEESIPVFRDLLGLEFLGEEEVPDQRVRVAKFDIGGVHIELLEPTSTDSPISQFIEKRGQGIHHISYRTNDIEGEIAGLISKGARMIDESPRIGAGGMKIAFVHPKSTAKVLTEICEG
ncbi:MAG TPA: methylmalonyl-CoA epimerase [candidate division Zixibacteria bacterium]|nr:methylmalonyl-CoA epimerase [candidate division Zixibacteria bacterium]